MNVLQTSQDDPRKSLAFALKIGSLAILGGTIHYGLWIYDRVFEYLWYPQAIIALGVVYGTAFMMLASYVVCLILLLGYDKLGPRYHWLRKALGYEPIKELGGVAEQELLNPKLPKCILGWQSILYTGMFVAVVPLWGVFITLLGVVFYPIRLFLYTLRRFFLRPLWLWLPWFRGVLVFLYLSVVFDPMTCTVLMRPKNKHTMDTGDWWIFYGSVFLSNVTWGLMVWTGVETLEALLPGLYGKIEAFVT